MSSFLLHCVSKIGAIYYLMEINHDILFAPLSISPHGAPLAENNEHSLGVNIREEEDAYILSALVPGLKADDLHIQVLEDVVRIEGEYKRVG